MKFLFNHGRNGVMRTVDILVSPVMDELKKAISCIQSNRPMEVDGNNWFSKKVLHTSVLILYSSFEYIHDCNFIVNDHLPTAEG